MSSIQIENNNSEELFLKRRYQRAESLIQGVFFKKLVLNSAVFPTWIEDSDLFWYERELSSGKQYRLVNASQCTNELAFDHALLARSLGKATDIEVAKNDLPLSNLEFSIDPLTICFTAFYRYWVYKIFDDCLIEKDLPIRLSSQAKQWIISPDESRAVFSRDHNLWLKNLTNLEEHQLTFDGEENFSYGLSGTAWGAPPGPIVLQALWSSDSSRILTIQLDRREIDTTPVVHYVPTDGQVRPFVEFVKVSYPGDEEIESFRLLSIDVIAGKIVGAKYDQMPVSREDWGVFTSKRSWWSKSGELAYFIDVSRDYKAVRVVEFNTDSGATRVLFEETSQTQINLMLNGDERPMLLPLPESNELLWMSERSGWAHLYLYDLMNGELKTTVSKGDWVIRDLLHFDSSRREVFVHTSGRVPGRDPYYRDLVRINIDSSDLHPIVSDDCEYLVWTQNCLNMDLFKHFVGGRGLGENVGGVSKTGNYVVVTRSRADCAPEHLLIDRYGLKAERFETTDLMELNNNWSWPEPVQMLAADGVTDIYGLIYRPSDFDDTKSYPIINHVYNTPDFPFVPKGSFQNGSIVGWPYLDAAALAELGFVVVQIDGRGLPYRSKGFHDESYGCLELASSLKDHVAGIRQLCERYKYLDITRVAITSHLGGGPGGLQGLLQYPDLYKVGVTMSLHDSRLMSAPMWGNKYEGMSGPIDTYQFPEELVDNLEGKLLLISGMLDTTNTPAAIFRVVDALQAANKDFDMLLLPNLGHDFINSYVVRRVWDYMVKHLLGLDPPKEFDLKTTSNEYLYKDDCT